MYSDWKRDYLKRRKSILADESLTDFEKQNALRTLAGIEPLTIQEKHLEAIENNIPIEGSLYSDAEKAAEASAQITKDYMKRFAEWLVIDSEWHYHTEKEMWTDGYSWVTIDELIEIFLETENK